MWGLLQLPEPLLPGWDDPLPLPLQPVLLQLPFLFPPVPLEPLLAPELLPLFQSLARHQQKPSSGDHQGQTQGEGLQAQRPLPQPPRAAHARAY